MSIVEEAQKNLDKELADYKLSRVTELLRTIARKKQEIKDLTKAKEEAIEKLEEEIEKVEKIKEVPSYNSVYANVTWGNTVCTYSVAA